MTKATATMHFFRFDDFADRVVYSDAEAFFADLTMVYREEIAALAGAGCKYIQLDEVALAMLCDPTIRGRVKTMRGNPEHLMTFYIGSINQAGFGCPRDVVAYVPGQF